MSALSTGREVVRTVREEHVLFMGASIAYYAITSLVPLLIVSLAVVSALGATGALVDVVQTALSDSGERVVEHVLADAAGYRTAGVLGLLVTVWAGSKVFQGIAVAFSEIYGDDVGLSLPARVARSLLVVGVLLGAVVLLSATGLAFAYVEFRVPYPRLLGSLAALVVLAVAFVPVYYLLSPVDTTVRHVLPGAVLAAVGWVLVQLGFYAYAQHAGRYAAFSFLGAVLLFVTALYLAATVLVLGGVVNDAVGW
ncbi:YihY/virulence factor BrkB family protein [Salinirubellus salinus]|uniref:YihY/virulence factor BrkB family protein n=1 Tax=Salinirubellus salinus TaxID=1364945 RepID=A0A9E7R352_9EURY|nr:YihY/virulence factor BrkB family protein [Salinirubellus salinus]UWM54399.1 YihY/virulence factor BrkB family protein [Salinirubellus salinus]